MLNLLKLILATWRLTSLLVQEAGPFDVFGKLRATAPHGGALDCIWCTSVWVAALLYMLRWQWLVDILAISAGAILYDKHASS